MCHLIVRAYSNRETASLVLEYNLTLDLNGVEQIVIIVIKIF